MRPIPRIALNRTVASGADEAGVGDVVDAEGEARGETLISCAGPDRWLDEIKHYGLDRQARENESYDRSF